jgi:hypothetical protein
MDEIPLPDMTPTRSTPVVEETQQTTPVGMYIDMPEVKTIDPGYRKSFVLGKQ